MTSPGLAEYKALRALASLFPGVEDTHRPARVSTFWAESAPSSNKSPKIPTFGFFVADSSDRPIFLTKYFH